MDQTTQAAATSELIKNNLLLRTATNKVAKRRNTFQKPKFSNSKKRTLSARHDTSSISRSTNHPPTHERHTSIEPHTDMDMGHKEGDGSPTSDAMSAPTPCHHTRHLGTMAASTRQSFRQTRHLNTTASTRRTSRHTRTWTWTQGE